MWRVNAGMVVVAWEEIVAGGAMIIAEVVIAVVDTIDQVIEGEGHLIDSAEAGLLPLIVVAEADLTASNAKTMGPVQEMTFVGGGATDLPEDTGAVVAAAAAGAGLLVDIEEMVEVDIAAAPLTTGGDAAALVRDPRPVVIDPGLLQGVTTIAVMGEGIGVMMTTMIEAVATTSTMIVITAVAAMMKGAAVGIRKRSLCNALSGI